MSDKGNSFIVHILDKDHQFVNIIKEYLSRHVGTSRTELGVNHLFFEKLKITGVCENLVKTRLTFELCNLSIIKNPIKSIPYSLLNFPSIDFFTPQF